MAKQAKAGRIRIGVSGWRYAGWRGKFYPPKLAQRKELAYAAGCFDSVELNGSFYSLQRPESFAQWRAETPEDFEFAVKGSRFITHMKKLRGVDEALANFFAQGLLRMGPKLGPVLWQFAPQFTFREEVLEEFFLKLPRTQKEAAKLAKKHDARLDGRDWVKAEGDKPIRHAVEIRHESFVSGTFVDLLRSYDVGLVVADTVEWPLLMDVTTDFVYCRLHGNEQLYASRYTDDQLEVWARRIVAWSRGGDSPDGRFASGSKAKKMPARDVYVYFDNDAKVHAPFDAQRLVTAVGRLLKA